MASSVPLGGFPTRYEILRPLGRGGMGEVDLARRTSDGLLVAVKWVVLPSPPLRLRFAREQRVLIDTHHPHVVRAYEAGEHEGRPYVVMEHLTGGSLKEHVADNGPRPVRWVVELGLELCDALGALHAAGVVHRDVKPSNLLFDAHGVVKLTDFGCAVRTTDPRITSPQGLLGTLRYMAPEQRVDAHDVDGRADVYALAATLLFALVGRSQRDLFSFRERPQLFAGVPPALVAPLQGALAWDRAERTPSARAFADALRAARDRVGGPAVVPVRAP